MRRTRKGAAVRGVGSTKWRLCCAALGMVASLNLCAPARAQLDSELDKPYRLQVVLHIADNRFLTPIFQEQVQRGVRDALQLALGKLAKVEVVRTHPLLSDIEAKGLETGLDGWEQISGVKTHFVLIDFAVGVYSLKARQYDGMTGLLSPLRQVQTTDRGLVAQTAVRLIEEDFGLVGTVQEVGKDVKLALKGGKLGERLDRWVKPGEVFAVCRMTKEGLKLRGTRVPWALLEVLDAPHDGFCRCRLWHRFQEDDLRALPGVLGYRCLKIASIPGPLKLRLIEDETFKPLDGVQVHVRRPGQAKPAELTTNRDGLLITRDVYPHMAFVQVLSGNTVRAQFPVELTGDRTVVCRLKSHADTEALAPLEFRKDQWVRRILDALRLAADRVGVLNAELTVATAGALETARTGLKSLDSELDHLLQERGQIEQQAREHKTVVDLREGNMGLETLRRRREDLERLITSLENVQKDSTSAATLGLAKLLERARLLEGEGDFPQALALYEKVLKARPDQPKVKEHLEKLQTEWVAKNPQHAEARAFLMATWPGLAVPELAQGLVKAQEALTVCKNVQDRLTPRKVIRANVVHAANLQKELDALKRQDNEDNRARAKVIAQVVDGLRRLHSEATALAGTALPGTARKD